MLSKYHPVGVMIYGNAEIAGVPWSVIIKEFRKKTLADSKRSTLQEYGDEFIKHLQGNLKYFPLERQRQYLVSAVSNIFDSINERITDEARDITEAGRKITTSEASSIIETQIVSTYKTLLNLEDLNTLPKYSYKGILKTYKDEINTIIQGKFPFLSPDNYLIRILRRITGLMFVKNTFQISDNFSGIVIAGFGDDEIYGTVIEYNIEAVINGNLKYFVRQNTSVKQNGSSVILPFAQQEMVRSFIEGVSPNYEATMSEYLRTLFTTYPKEIIKQISGLDSKQKNSLLKGMNEATDDLIEKFLAGVNNWTRINILPVLGTVAFLPLEELASMAKSLVNLTSFKRRVTMGEAETVGGPIDVAVISKGDGFIWINRKHYFDANYNPHFGANYYRE